MANLSTRFLIREAFARHLLSDAQLVDAATLAVRASIAETRIRPPLGSLESEAAVLRMYYSYRHEEPQLPKIFQVLGTLSGRS
jgi:hypothetical protein